MMRIWRGLCGVGAMALLGGAAAGCGNGVPVAAGGGGGAAASCGTAGTSLGAAAVTIAAKPGGAPGYVWSPTSDPAKVGQVVEWTNPSDGTLHNIGVDGCPDFSNTAFAPGQTWQVKFTKAGTYAFHCTIHPGMDGMLTVS